MGAGRPPKFKIEELRENAESYLNGEGYKTIADFCRKTRISRRHFWELCENDEELSHLREMITLERECYLERGGLSGDLNSSMAKFALAQIGWTDKQEIQQDITSGGEKLELPMHTFIKTGD